MDSTKPICTIADLSKFVDSECRDDKATTVLYRGHGAASFGLRPKVGRLKPTKNSTDSHVNESLMLELFRRQAVDRVEVNPADDWELLAIAQHHGMATRLLDWTRSPLVALYFAVSTEFETRLADGRPKEEDAEVLAWRCGKQDLSKALPKQGPLEIDEVIRYIPRIVTPRLRAQSGVFTAHHRPNEEFMPNEGFVRLRIPHKERRNLKKSLFRHGIHEATLFPDLDALSRHIEWCQTECY